MDNPKKLTHISLCAGYGGIDLGLKRAIGDVRTVCYVEIENFVIDNLVKKIEAGLIDNCPVYTNLKTFPWELFSGRVDILSGGFPCQPFSAAGRRKGSEDPRHLWPYITDGIKRLGRPAIVYFENVEGIISSKIKGEDWADPEGTPVLLHVLRELERMGYKATASVFSACEVGAPHQRKRVFILGVRNDLTQTSINLINELIKRNDSHFELGHTKSKQDDFRELRDLDKEKPKVGQKLRNASRSSSRSTAYPSPRGQRQYWYEPPRVTMGNTLHDGPLDSKESRDTNEASDNNTQGQESTIESKRTSRPCGNGSLQTSKLGNSDGRDEESHGGEHRVLHSVSECREAGGLERTGENAKPRELHRQIEPSLGRDADGVANRLDYAELYESCDNRTDELRMLGNGVVPDTATRAFRVLWGELVYSTK